MHYFYIYTVYTYHIHLSWINWIFICSIMQHLSSQPQRWQADVSDQLALVEGQSNWVLCGAMGVGWVSVGSLCRGLCKVYIYILKITVYHGSSMFIIFMIRRISLVFTICTQDLQTFDLNLGSDSQTWKWDIGWRKDLQVGLQEIQLDSWIIHLIFLIIWPHLIAWIFFTFSFHILSPNIQPGCHFIFAWPGAGSHS